MNYKVLTGSIPAGATNYLKLKIMIDWERLLKAISIVATALLIFYIFAIIIKWLVINHLLIIVVIGFVILFIIGIIYILLGEFND